MQHATNAASIMLCGRGLILVMVVGAQTYASNSIHTVLHDHFKSQRQQPNYAGGDGVGWDSGGINGCGDESSGGGVDNDIFFSTVC